MYEYRPRLYNNCISICALVFLTASQSCIGMYVSCTPLEMISY